MAKIHTRQKRKRNLRSSRFQHTTVFSRIVKLIGPKSFKTKEAADAWAKDNKTDGLVLHHTGSKYQWRAKPRG